MSASMHILPNGLTVAADPIAGAESVAVGLYASVGSRSEPEHLGGLAHLVEHMVFKGAGGRDTRTLAEAIEDVGGSLNAWTARDQTVFHGRALARDLSFVTELIADLVRAPHFDEEHLEREKQVILSELGEVFDAPDDLVHDHLFEAAFDAQPLGRSVLGTEQSIRAAGRKDCLDWLHDQFVPSRLVSSASGKIEPRALLDSRRKHVRGHAVRSTHQASSLRPSPAGCVTTAGASNRRIGVSHSAVSRRATRGCLRCLCSCRRWEAERPRGCFKSFARNGVSLIPSMPGTTHLTDVGLVGIGCAAERARAAESVQLARELLGETADKLTQPELDRARAQIEAGLLMTLETPQGRADHMARSIEVFGRILSLDELLDHIRAVTIENARAVGRALLDGPVAVASVGAALALAA